MLDDVLSAVDAQVARWILSNAIMGPHMLQKTRILCTHNVQVVPLNYLLFLVYLHCLLRYFYDIYTNFSNRHFSHKHLWETCFSFNDTIQYPLTSVPNQQVQKEVVECTSFYGIVLSSFYDIVLYTHAKYIMIQEGIIYM